MDGGLNLFAYCNNNPVNYYDFDGEDAVSATAWAASMWWLLGIDGLLPVGDFLFSVGFVVASLSIISWDTNNKYEDGGTSDYASAKNDTPSSSGTPSARGVSTPAAPEPPNNNNKNKKKTKNDGTPKNNQRQNKQIDDICRKYRLTKDQRKMLHREISHKNYGYHEIEEIAKWIAYMGR